MRTTHDVVYDRFCRGFTNGEWDPFFELVSDEVDFYWPTNPGAGRFNGADGRAAMEERFRRFGGALRMTDINVIARSEIGDTVIYEDESSGDMAGTPYHARHCIFFTLQDGRVVGYREYTGDV